MQEKDPKLYGDVIESTISRTKVPVKTLLGESKINVSDFINLQVGTLLKLIKKLIRNSMFMLATSRSLKHYLVTLKINTQLE